MFSMLLPDFNHNWRVWTEFRSSSPYRVSRKYVQWGGGVALIHADRRADRQNTGNRRFSRECAWKESSIEMDVIDGHLPYLFRLKRSGTFYLKIKDIIFSIRYRDANHTKQQKIIGLKAYGTTCSPHALQKCWAWRATKREGAARASMSFHKTSTPQLPPHNTREVPTTYVYTVCDVGTTAIRSDRSDLNLAVTILILQVARSAVHKISGERSSYSSVLLLLTIKNK
jgi:hypothetical protein